MKYDFICDKCSKQIELSVHHTELKTPNCCDQEMKRIYTPILTKTVGVGGNSHQGLH
jgi:hypothetical protein